WDDLLHGEEIEYLGTEPAREARLAPFPDELHPRVRDALAAQGIEELYPHQRAAWDAATRGEHVVVTTGTASGKTLAFNLPVLDAIAREPKQRALYLYPTKALAQDQLRSLSTFRLPRLRAAIYDGDTESERRWQIRKWANLVLTNPDMLHVGVLPHHDRWGDVLSNLRYVIVDEELVLRASPLGEGSRVLGDLVSRGLRTLLFAKSRKAAELIHRFAADRLGDASRLSPYRAGYTPAQRREIEQRLSAGELLGVS